MLPSKSNTNLVSIQARQISDGEFGEVVTWVENRQCWVSISPDRGREINSGPEKTSIVTHTVRGDFLELEGVDETMRIVHNLEHAYDPISDSSQVYDIEAVMPDIDGRGDVMLRVALDSRSFSKISPNRPE